MSAVPTSPPPPAYPDAETVSRARAEALSMAGPADRGAGAGGAGHPHGELLAAALHSYSALSAGLGRLVPLTALGPDGGGVRGLTAFLAVYGGWPRPGKVPGLGPAA